MDELSKLGAIANHKNGKEEGEFKIYKENGELEKTVHYKNGVRIDQK